MNRDDIVQQAIREKNIELILSSFFDDSIREVRANFKTETELWDYKRKHPEPSGSNLEWAEISKDVLSFYNTKRGGLLFFGVDDNSSTQKPH